MIDTNCLVVSGRTNAILVTHERHSTSVRTRAGQDSHSTTATSGSEYDVRAIHLHSSKLNDFTTTQLFNNYIFAKSDVTLNE